MRWCSLAFLVGCTSSYGDVTDDPELPPRGEDDVEPWIREGHYLAWRCEPDPVDVRLGSPHRPQTRTCSNALVHMAGAGAGELPVGAASVKELYDASARIMGYAVSRKMEPGGASSWYWYERLRDNGANADGANESSCTGCHRGAARDFTFVVAP